MIVLKHNDTIYIAKSCWTMRDPEARRTGVPDVENISMWHPKKKKNRIIASSSVGRFVDAIRYEDIFPSTLDQKHLFFESYDKMYAIADRFGLCDGVFIPAITFFAEDDRAFVLFMDGANIEVEDIFVISLDDNHVEIDDQHAVMPLYDLKGVSDPYEFFKEAFKISEEIQKKVLFPITVMNTKSNKIEMINR